MDCDEKFLGSGSEGSVYRVGEYAIKIYYPTCSKKRLDKNLAYKLHYIDTKRFLMPRNILLDEDKNIRGYSTKYIEDLGVDSFYKLDRDSLKNELSILKEDLIKLSSNNIIVGDLNIPNTSFNNGIYLIDSGSYQYMDSYDEVRSFGENIEVFNEYLLTSILSTCSYHLIKNRKRVNKYLRDTYHNYIDSSSPDLIEYFISNIEEDNLEEYIIRKNR